MSRTYYVYILASRSRSLYTGVTNNLSRRLIEHRQGLVPGFTSKYRVFRLVHCEVFADIRDAIAREKEIKGWRREKKVQLIQFRNRVWADLAEKADSSPPFAKGRRPGSE
jgi:putative endonuclease